MQRRAERAETPSLYHQPPGATLDVLAKSVVDGREDDTDEDRFIGVMKDYLQNLSAESRWLHIAAIAKAYGADFKTLVKFLRDRDVPTRVRAPAAGSSSPLTGDH